MRSRIAAFSHLNWMSPGSSNASTQQHFLRRQSRRGTAAESAEGHTARKHRAGGGFTSAAIATFSMWHQSRRKPVTRCNTADRVLISLRIGPSAASLRWWRRRPLLYRRIASGMFNVCDGLHHFTSIRISKGWGPAGGRAACGTSVRFALLRRQTVPGVTARECILPKGCSRLTEGCDGLHHRERTIRVHRSWASCGFSLPSRPASTTRWQRSPPNHAAGLDGGLGCRFGRK